MRITSILGLFMLFFIAIGCKQEPKQEPETPAFIVHEMVSPADTVSSLPHLVTNKDVTLLSWVEKVGDTMTTLYYAELIDGNWAKPQTILQGGDWFVNWADYPIIVENKGNLWSHVLKKSTSGTYSYDVKINVRPKGANAWKTDLPVHTDGTPTEHGFVSAVPYNDAFFVTWLDGRNTVENEAGERGAMTVRAGVLATTGELLEDWELDNRTCDCCQTTTAITDNGPVVLYRDRSADEIRDIYIVRQVQGEWTAPKAVHDDGWEIKGCPVNGPRASAMGNNLAVAWFTGAQKRSRVQVAFSADGGEAFQTPILISEGNVMGRVDVAWITEDTAIVSWMESEGETAFFKAVKVSTNGTLSKKHVLTEMNGSRSSGFPQLEKVNDQLYIAWTEQSSTSSQLRTAKIALSAFD